FGCGAHGDALDFLVAIEGADFVGAVEIAATIAGMVAGELPTLATTRPAQPLRLSPAELERQKEAEIECARGVFAAGTSAIGNIVEVYLGSRGIAYSPPASLRFPPAL